jgi:chromosome segregation ATPase
VICDRLRTETEDLKGRQSELQGQLAQATDDLAARNKEIDEVEGRLQATRQALLDVQAKLAEARQQLAAPPAAPAPAQRPCGGGAQ